MSHGIERIRYRTCPALQPAGALGPVEPLDLTCVMDHIDSQLDEYDWLPQE